MSKVEFNLKQPTTPAVPLVSEIDALRPAVVKTREGRQLVVVKVFTTSDMYTYIVFDNRFDSPMWSSRPDIYTFVRYLGKDEAVTFYGSAH